MVVALKNTKINIDFNRLKATLEKSSSIGTIPGDGLRRLALSEEDKKMRDIFLNWMKEAGLEIRIDEFGNMFGRRAGKANLTPIMIGSHLDTQPNGGRFDGVLGVLSALEVIRTLNDQQIETNRPIEVVNFTNEEGARFEPALLGSGGATGIFSLDYVYSRTDVDGKTFESELEHIGYKGEKQSPLSDIHAFIELHIEQGPILENEKKEIGVVQGVKGMTWMELKVTGSGGHAGPTPMNLRKDALMKVANMIVYLEEKAKQWDEDLSVTIGRMHLSPGVVNCIPEEVVFSLDIRHVKDEIREQFIKETKQDLQDMCEQEQFQLSITDLWQVSTTHFHSKIIKKIKEVAKKLDLSTRELYSGAGHDAKYMSDICPTGMIFLPSIGGISHVEHELSLDSDIENAANVLLHTVLKLDNEQIK